MTEKISTSDVEFSPEKDGAIQRILVHALENGDKATLAQISRLSTRYGAKEVELAIHALQHEEFKNRLLALFQR